MDWGHLGQGMKANDILGHVYRKFSPNKELCPASQKQEVTLAESNTAPQRLLLANRDVQEGRQSGGHGAR